MAAAGADLEAIKREILAVLDDLRNAGPEPQELQRAQNALESDFLRSMESLLRRADLINAYHHHFGVADGFQRDLDRSQLATVESVRRWTAEVFGPGRVDLRVLPESASSAGASLDERPEDFPPGSFVPPAPHTFELSNGIRVHAQPRPGTRLFSGALHVEGGERLVTPEKAGLATLASHWIESGAGGLDAEAFAQAVDALGASVSVGALRRSMEVSVSGLSSRFDETLDRFADLVLRPNLTADDFAREKELHLARIQARSDDPTAVAANAARVLMFGKADVRGRALGGDLESIGGLSRDDISALLPRLFHPGNATFVFAGDFELERLERALEARFGSWTGTVERPQATLEAVVDPPSGRLVLIDRPGAPQTVVRLMRPLDARSGPARAAREAVATVFGGTFTSRLNSNLREDKGYTYGARSRVDENGEQVLLTAGAAVRTDATGASLTEFKREFEAMHSNGISAPELSKAIETARLRAVERGETTADVLEALLEHVRQQRPLDSDRAAYEDLGRVDLAAANAAARDGTYAWDELLIVLVGDRETILSQLADAGFSTPLAADAEGNLIP